MSHLRLIARLDVMAPNLVKGVRLEGLRVVCSPSEHASRYSGEGAGEIHYEDIVASLYRRSSTEHLGSETASEVLIPLMEGVPAAHKVFDEPVMTVKRFLARANEFRSPHMWESEGAGLELWKVVS